MGIYVISRQMAFAKFQGSTCINCISCSCVAFVCNKRIHLRWVNLAFREGTCSYLSAYCKWKHVEPLKHWNKEVLTRGYANRIRSFSHHLYYQDGELSHVKLQGEEIFPEVPHIRDWLAPLVNLWIRRGTLCLVRLGGGGWRREKDLLALLALGIYNWPRFFCLWFDPSKPC